MLCRVEETNLLTIALIYYDMSDDHYSTPQSTLSVAQVILRRVQWDTTMSYQQQRRVMTDCGRVGRQTSNYTYVSNSGADPDLDNVAVLM